MKETEFRNKYFYWIIILIIGGLLLKTIFTTFYYNQSVGIFPMIIQFLLLIFILTKHKYARIGIIIWTTLFMLVLSAVQLAQGLVRNFNYGIDISWLQYYLTISVNLIVGTIVLFYTIKTTKVIANTKQES
jgi:hypothetical protein